MIQTERESKIKKGTYQVQTNLSVQIMETSIWAIRLTSKGRGAERWEEEFVKVWLSNPMVNSDCKIIQSPVLLGCWSNDSDWSFYSFYGEVGSFPLKICKLYISSNWCLSNLEMKYHAMARWEILASPRRNSPGRLNVIVRPCETNHVLDVLWHNFVVGLSPPITGGSCSGR